MDSIVGSCWGNRTVFSNPSPEDNLFEDCRCQMLFGVSTTQCKCIFPHGRQRQPPFQDTILELKERLCFFGANSFSESVWLRGVSSHKASQSDFILLSFREVPHRAPLDYSSTATDSHNPSPAAFTTAGATQPASRRLVKSCSEHMYVHIRVTGSFYIKTQFWPSFPQAGMASYHQPVSSRSADIVELCDSTAEHSSKESLLNKSLCLYFFLV